MLTAEALSRLLEDFLADAATAVVVEDGEQLFDFSSGRAAARYAVTAADGKCLLHLWSPERNTMRRVLDAELKKEALQLSVQRFGKSKPSRLEIFRSRDRRAPVAKKSARAAYTLLLRRVLERSFPDFAVTQLTSATDLERSFGPVYTRGLIRRGRSAFAVLGANSQETQASLDAALTFGLLWLDHCRQREAAHVLVEGLKLFLPAGSSAVVRERLACLDPTVATVALYELEEREQAVESIDCHDRGNIQTRLVHCVDQAAARARFQQSIARVLEFFPARTALVDTVALSSSEIAFRLRGLEFARAHLTPDTSFRNREQVTFGAGPHETPLSSETEGMFAELARRLAQERDPRSTQRGPLWRMQPERWLESLALRDIALLDSSLDASQVYSQVPAFSASDRAMIDVLACTREGRLVVIELKADEDIHLPLQGLDYWARVQWHNSRGEFQRFGYFPGRPPSPAPPLLRLVAPALHVHPATDALLRYISPEIDCTLLGIDERWREGVRVVFRKPRERQRAANC